MQSGGRRRARDSSSTTSGPAAPAGRLVYRSPRDVTPSGAARPRVLGCGRDLRSIHALRTVLCAAALDVDTTTRAEEAPDRAAIRLPHAAIVALELHDREGSTCVSSCASRVPYRC